MVATPEASGARRMVGEARGVGLIPGMTADACRELRAATESADVPF